MLLLAVCHHAPDRQFTALKKSSGGSPPPSVCNAIGKSFSTAAGLLGKHHRRYRLLHATDGTVKAPSTAWWSWEGYRAVDALPVVAGLPSPGVKAGAVDADAAVPLLRRAAVLLLNVAHSAKPTCELYVCAMRVCAIRCVSCSRKLCCER